MIKTISNGKGQERAYRLPQVLCVAGIIAGALMGCNTSDNPQLDMCQTITKNLAGEIAEWPQTETRESGKVMIVSGNYKLASGNTGEVTCVYPRENLGNDATDTRYRTSPEQVTINGEKIGAQALITAGFKATSEKIGEISTEAARQSKKLSDETTEKAEEITQQAESAIKKAEQQVGEAASNLSEKLQQAAEDAADGVKKALE